MTGTAMTEAAEFDQIYKLGVVPIPTNRPMVRADQADLVYSTEEAKFDAVVDDIAERHEKGQPILVGTVERREVRAPVRAADASAASRTRCSTPSSTSDEAQIVAQAGRKGAVTVATNMAGRGTDIMLGGNRRVPGRPASCAQRGLDPVETPEEYEAAWPAALEKVKDAGRRPSTTRSRRSAGSTCSAPSGTSRGASTTSCAVGPAVRATRASPGSTCRSRTT